MKRTRKGLAELAAGMQKFPQKMVNVRVGERFDAAADPAVAAAVAKVEQALAGRGRVVLRASGTEPVIRVMVEGEDNAAVAAHAAALAEVVRQAAP
jgi:phosphoglucosamine mutase